MFKRESKFIITVILYLITNNQVFAQINSNWKIQPVAIQTRWAKDVNPTNVLPDYPRPQMVRKHWQNLNGLWNYTLTPQNVFFPSNFDGEILVPFPLESALSGVKKKLLPTENIWYSRSFARPALKEGEKLLLHFGAVDWQATVFINGKEVGTHKGGYTSFSFDITKSLQAGENKLVVKVYDPTDQGIGPHGKQVLDPSNIYYTPSSGIWQTVWLEVVPMVSIESLKITPDIDKGVLNLYVNICKPSATVTTQAGGISNGNILNGVNNIIDGYKIEVIVISNGKTVNHVSKDVSKDHLGADGALVIPISNPRLWSPDDPFLYDLLIRIKKNNKVVDEVKSYFGMRKISIAKDSKGVDRIFLNNRPYFNLGTLDQGFWPEGLYAAPTDEALRFDIEAIKIMGFNTIRKHIKVEPARWYYYTDKLGMLVWQDMVNPNQSLPEGSKEEFERESEEILTQLHNYPSITTWVLFNEKWGQYDQERLTKWIKKTDPSRLINGHSGELLYVNNELRSPSPNAYVSADMTDVHSYPFPRSTPSEIGKAKVLGEFGGIGVSIEGHIWDDLAVGWGYDGMVSSETMEKQYKQMVDSIKILESAGLSGSIYTQPYDVESEQNGLMTYDRAVIKLPIKIIRNIHSEVWPATSNYLSAMGLTLGLALESGKFYAARLKDYDAGKRDSAFLRSLTIMAFGQKDTKNAVKIANDYIKQIKDVFAETNLRFIRDFTRSTKDTGFTIIFNNSHKINKVLGKDVTELIISKLISEEIQPAIFNKIDPPDFTKLETEIERKYGNEGKKVFLMQKAMYYYDLDDFNKWFSTKEQIHNKYPDATSTFDMNNDAWLLFEKVSDRRQLEIALSWSKKVIEKDPTGNYYDTYANILYKLGRKEEAIKMEEQGLQLPIGNGFKESLIKALEKMKRNEPTWSSPSSRGDNSNIRSF